MRQVVEVEEYASVNDSGDPIQSADNTPKFKEDSVSSRQQSDPRTPGSMILVLKLFFDS